MALLGVNDVIQEGRHLGFHSKVMEKWRKLKVFVARRVDYGVIKQFAAFCRYFVLFYGKGEKRT